MEKEIKLKMVKLFQVSCYSSRLLLRFSSWVLLSLYLVQDNIWLEYSKSGWIDGGCVGD